MKNTELPAALRLLRSKRSYRGLSQTELAKAIGVSKQTICEVERGNQRPNRVTLIKMSDRLGLNSSEARQVFSFFGRSQATEADVAAIQIRRVRQDAGMTQQALAVAIGMSRAAISKAEAGQKIVFQVGRAVYDYFKIPINEDYEYPAPEDLGEADTEGEQSSGEAE